MARAGPSAKILRSLSVTMVAISIMVSVSGTRPVISKSIYQSDEILAGMDEWNTEHHTNSGLIQRIKDSNVSIQQAEKQTIDFLQAYVNPSHGLPPVFGLYAFISFYYEKYILYIKP
jgi:oligoribonuclease